MATRHLLSIALAACAILGSAAPAHAQPLTSLDEARDLFKAAVSDEDDFHRYDEALAKFRRVQGFKDSVNVRYRIGTCLEQLGQYAAAFASYEGALKLGADEPGSDVFKASQERAADVEKRVAKVRIVLSAHAPPDAEVRVDDQKVGSPGLKEPIVLDAGHHTFSGTAAGLAPFRTSLTLGEGSHVSITIALDPPSQQPAADGGAHALPSVTRSTHMAGWITLGAGGALLAGAGVFALLERAAVDDLHSQCPGGTCGTAQRSSLSSERSRALVYEPLSIGLGAAGVVAAGIGLYLVLKPDVIVTPTAGGISVRGAF